MPADKRADYEGQLGQKRSKVNIETFNSPQAVLAGKALRKMLCKQYLTTFDKVKITGISLIKSVNNNYWLLPQDRIRQC